MFDDEEDDDQYDDEPREPQEFGCCLPPGECVMPGLHFPSECHTAADYEQDEDGQFLSIIAESADAVPPGYALVPIEPTPKMVAAYLNANDEYWKRADELPPSLFKWRNGTPKDATVESYRAMIAAAGDKT